jgi:hypothetical protein
VARLDTHWHNNPKVLALGLAAMGLHAWSISYCDSELTDGFIPAAALPSLPGVASAVRALVAGGRWGAVAGGYQLHDYLVHNRSRETVLSERERNAARKRDGRRNGSA